MMLLKSGDYWNELTWVQRFYESLSVTFGT